MMKTTTEKETDWFYEAVAYVNRNGLMGSTSTAESTFEPGTTTLYLRENLQPV